MPRVFTCIALYQIILYNRDMSQKDFDVLDKVIGRVVDFPVKGVLFYDITGILRHPDAFKYCIDRMIEIYKGKNLDAVAAIESRGFIFAAPFAITMGLPLILVRKKGKLPGKTYTMKYSLEYGQAEIEVHTTDVQKGQNILLIDDLIATGGTLKASVELLAKGGARVPEVFGVIGLPFLNYGKRLEGINVTTLVNYQSE